MSKCVNNNIKNNVISKNIFYKHRHRNPNLQTIIKIANYLKTSIDYIYERDDENHFKRYAQKKERFYNNLIKMIDEIGVSSRHFCRDLNFAKDNLLRYKNGVYPSIRTVYEIAEYSNCPIDELLTKER